MVKEDPVVDFVKPISNKDITACQRLIADLKNSLPNEVAYWEQPLVSLVKGIELHFDDETLLAILEALPAKINEALILKLLTQGDHHSSYLNTLVTHINTLESNRAHQVSLIYNVLSSPIPLSDQPETQELLFKLSAKEQGALLNHLRNQADQCLIKKKDQDLSYNQKKLNQTYKANFQQLLLFLTIHASKTETTLQISLSEDPTLSNLIIGQLLEATLGEKKQKKLLINLFKESNNYDWSDPFFNKIIRTKLITIIASLPAEELKEYLNPYVTISLQQHHYITNIIDFLDELYTETTNIPLITHCLKAIDDEELIFTSNFLTHSKTFDRALRQHILKTIDICRLVNFYSYIIVLGQMGHDPDRELFTDYMSIFCDHLKTQPCPQELFNQFISHIPVLSIDEERLVITTILNHLPAPEQKSLWLQALIKAYKNKTSLLPYCLQFIQEHPDEFHLLLPVLKNMTSEDLLDLYLLMQTKGLNKKSFHCFRELFKDREKLPQLFYILINTPTVNHELLNEFIAPLDDATIISLVDNLLTKTPNSEFKTTINQVLLIFCQRLYADQNPNAAIHHWKEQPFTEILAQHLLENPECVSHLTMTYSTLYSLVTWSNPTTALKYRMDAILNSLELKQDRINQIALLWLDYFRATPEQLYTLFYNLHYSESNRTLIGKENLLKIKQACWQLIKPGISFKENEFLNLFHKPKKELFDPVVTLLMNEEHLQKDLHYASLWFAKTANTLPNEMNDEIVINLLIHSTHEKTLVNWKKVRVWLEQYEPEKQLIFANKLIDKGYKSNNNPILNQQIYQFITQHHSFDSLLPQLNPEHWYWLIKCSPPVEIIQKISTWLDLIIQQHEIRSLNLGKLLALLPQNESLLCLLLKKPAFAHPDIFAQIFAQLSGENDCSVLFATIHQFINEQDKLWVNQFLKTAMKQINAVSMNTAGIQVLHTLILNNASTFSSQIPDDQTLIIDYLKLLNTLLQQSDKSNPSTTLKQLMISLLTAFLNPDSPWNQLIFDEDAFTQTVSTWIHNTDFKTLEQSIKDHPLTNLLIDSQPANLNPKLKKDLLFQKWLFALLSNPPAKLQRKQFHPLFDLLLSENKVLLSQQILVKTQLAEVHTHSVDILANALKPPVLFELFEQKINPDLIARGLFTHQEGLIDLSLIQRTKLFKSINSSAYLISLLDNQTTVDSRINFIKELFLIYGQNATTLSQILSQWNINAESLAALTNFTVVKKHLILLDEVLKEKSYYRNFLNDYLHHPTLEMPLNKDSYLYHLARQNLLNTATKKPCKAEFIKQLSPEDSLTVIKTQFNLNQNIQSLSSLFNPFTVTPHNAVSLLHSTRWQQRLMLIHSGLLEVVSFYQDEKTPSPTKQIIEQTELYNDFILPLLNKSLKEDFRKIPFTKLFSSLHHYCKTVSHLDLQHYEHVQSTLNRYTTQLSTIKNFSSPRLYEFFKIDSPEEETIFQLNPAAIHQAWLARYDLEPEKHFSDVLNFGLQEIQLMQNGESANWIFQFALFSTLSTQLNETILRNYLTSTNPSELAVLTFNFFEKIQNCRTAYEVLHKIKPIESITDFLKQLVTKELSILNQLKNVSESLNLVVLNDLICFALSIKNLELNEEQITTLILSTDISSNQEVNWLQTELRSMHEQLAKNTARLDQLISIGFSYNQDNQNALRLSHLIHKNLADIPINVLLVCLNSYGPIFVKDEGDSRQFLKTLDEILKKPQTVNEIITGLDASIISQIIDAAIKEPALYSALLEKIINSTWSELCLHQLQLALNELIKQNEDPQPISISQLSAEQVEGYPSAALGKILAIQRLLFYGEPTPELTSFANLSEMQDTESARQLFCADASLFRVIINLQKNSIQPMIKSTSWLAQHSQANVKNYAAAIDAFNSGKEISYPTVQCYWLCWKAFIFAVLYNNKNILIEGLLDWLNRLDETQLQNALDLNHLLTWVITQKLITKVFNNILEHRVILNASQIAWLCEQSLKTAPKNSTLYPLIINLSSWSWLENYMKNGSPQNFALLKAALGNKQYLKDINENEATQSEFLNTLNANKFSYPQILELITLVQSDQIRSLLIMHLLIQPEYLASFKGESILMRVTKNEIHTPSRLNALIHQLDIKTLTTTMIEKLPPEAAVSILCSVPHFHQFKEHQIAALIKQCPKPEVITYWLTHYSSMPNAHFTLVHLMKLADSHLIAEINKMDASKKEALIINMIRHLEFFNPDNKLLHEEQNEESHLILAIRLFLNGHQHKAYVNYINLLTDKLVLKNHQFSLETIQLIISLNEKEEFTNLTSKSAYLINHYLRAKAQLGEIGIFYHAGHMNIDSMNQRIHLIPTRPKAPVSQGFFASLLGIKPEPVDEPATGTAIPEHSIIEKMAQYRKQITAFDYFLIHFKGDNQKISNAINDYLGFYAREGCTTQRRKSVHQLCELMNRPEIETPIRDLIFTSFLHYPELYDQYISSTLFLYDAKRTIQYFGMRGGEKNYTHVIDLCDLALKRLDPGQHKEIINTAKTARAEAELELTFNEERSFFANLFRRLKRCWISGWTGFFNPNLPIYVAPSSSSTSPDLNTSKDTEPHLVPYRLEPNLCALLKETRMSFTQDKLDELGEAINLYSFKAPSKNEIGIREKLHCLFHQLREDSKQNKTIADWLIKNQSLFTKNWFKLMELTLIKGPRKAVDILVKQINEEPSDLQNIFAELNCSLPVQQEEMKKEPIMPPSPEPDIIESTLLTATQIAYDAWSWTRGGLETFFKAESPPQIHEKRSETSCIGLPTTLA